MEDKLIRVMTTNKEIRALAVRSTEIVKKAQELQKTTPVATAALGRVLTANLLMGSMVKTGEVTSLKVVGDGPLKKIVAEANQYGHVRGYVANPSVDYEENDKGKLDVASAIGKGQLVVRKKLGLKEPYEGQVPLISGEIGDDLTYYFTKSEQTPSSVGVGVLIDKDLSVKAAGGFIIQLLPDPSDETIDKLEENLSDIDSISHLIDKGVDPEGLMDKLLDGFRYRITSQKDVEYNCNCSEKRIKGIIHGLGEEELKETLEQEGMIEIRCHFCGEIYQFSEEDIEQVLAEKEEADKEIGEE